MSRSNCPVALSGLALLLGVATACAAPAAAPAPTPSASPPVAVASPSPPAGAAAAGLALAAKEVDAAIAAAQAGDLARAKGSFEAYDQAWDTIEDDVKQRSPEAYRSIEDAADAAKAALEKASPPDKDASVAALQRLRQVLNEQAPRLAL